jgi:hypothetical protein
MANKTFNVNIDLKDRQAEKWREISGNSKISIYKLPIKSTFATRTTSAHQYNTMPLQCKFIIQIPRPPT